MSFRTAVKSGAVAVLVAIVKFLCMLSGPTPVSAAANNMNAAAQQIKRFLLRRRII
jgi:hypothetical protein